MADLIWVGNILVERAVLVEAAVVVVAGPILALVVLICVCRFLDSLFSRRGS